MSSLKLISDNSFPNSLNRGGLSDSSALRECYSISPERGTLFSEIWGQGSTQVLLNHGSTEVPSYGEAFLQYLSSSSSSLVIPHRRGMGKSLFSAQMPGSAVSLLVEDLNYVQRDISVPRWNTIVGDSFGAALSILQARDGKTDSLVLFAPSLLRQSQWDLLFNKSTTPFPESRHRIDNLLSEYYPEKYNNGDWSTLDYIQILDFEMTRIINTSDYLVSDQKRDCMNKSCMSWRLFGNEDSSVSVSDYDIADMRSFAEQRICFIRVMAQQLTENDSVDILQVAAGLEIPCTIIHDPLDPFVPIENSHELCQVMPDCELIEISGIGHNFSNPKALTAAAAAVTKANHSLQERSSLVEQSFPSGLFRETENHDF